MSLNRKFIYNFFITLKIKIFEKNKKNIKLKEEKNSIKETDIFLNSKKDKN